MATARIRAVAEAQEPEVHVRWITPQLAAEWLARGDPNRRLSEGNITKYARDMQEGRWLLNGEGAIVFGKSGRLLNGQNRLNAVIRAGIPVRMIVSSGVDDAAMVTIDTGKPRSFADVLTIDGVPDPFAKAALTRLYWQWESYRNLDVGRAPASVQTLLDVWAEHQDEFTEAVKGAHRAYKYNAGGQAVWSLAWVLLTRVDPGDAALFFARVADGQDLASGDARYALRRWSENRRKVRSSAQVPNDWLLQLIMRAWNKWRAGEACEVLTARAGEPIPEPI